MEHLTLPKIIELRKLVKADNTDTWNKFLPDYHEKLSIHVISSLTDLIFNGLLDKIINIFTPIDKYSAHQICGIINLVMEYIPFNDNNKISICCNTFIKLLLKQIVKLIKIDSVDAFVLMHISELIRISVYAIIPIVVQYSYYNDWIYAFLQLSTPKIFVQHMIADVLYGMEKIEIINNKGKLRSYKCIDMNPKAKIYIGPFNNGMDLKEKNVIKIKPLTDYAGTISTLNIMPEYPPNDKITITAYFGPNADQPYTIDIDKKTIWEFQNSVKIVVSNLRLPSAQLTMIYSGTEYLDIKYDANGKVSDIKNITDIVSGCLLCHSQKVFPFIDLDYDRTTETSITYKSITQETLDGFLINPIYMLSIAGINFNTIMYRANIKDGVYKIFVEMWHTYFETIKKLKIKIVCMNSVGLGVFKGPRKTDEIAKLYFRTFIFVATHEKYRQNTYDYIIYNVGIEDDIQLFCDYCSNKQPRNIPITIQWHDNNSFADMPNNKMYKLFKKKQDEKQAETPQTHPYIRGVLGDNIIITDRDVKSTAIELSKHGLVCSILNPANTKFYKSTSTALGHGFESNNTSVEGVLGRMFSLPLGSYKYMTPQRYFNDVTVVSPLDK